MVNVECIRLEISNDLVTNSFLVFDENKEAILIDPGNEEEKIINKINELCLNVSYIVITHAHSDHIGALESLQKFTSAKILVHKNDFSALVGDEENYSNVFGMKIQNIDREKIICVEDGFKIKVGKTEYEVVHTPGHTSGSICIYVSNENILFTGDTVFCNSYGRCDLLSGSFDDMVMSLKKIFDRFDDVIIYPGHDESTRIQTSKKYIKMLLLIKGIHI